MTPQQRPQRRKKQATHLRTFQRQLGINRPMVKPHGFDRLPPEVTALITRHLNARSKSALTVATKACARDPDKEFGVLVRKTALVAYALAGDDRGVRRAVLARRVMGQRDFERFHVKVKRPNVFYSVHLRGHTFEAIIPNTDRLYFELRSPDCTFLFQFKDRWPHSGWVVSMPKIGYKPHVSSKTKEVIERELRAAHMARPRDHWDDDDEFYDNNTHRRRRKQRARSPAMVWFTF